MNHTFFLLHIFRHYSLISLIKKILFICGIVYTIIIVASIATASYFFLNFTQYKQQIVNNIFRYTGYLVEFDQAKTAIGWNYFFTPQISIHNFTLKDPNNSSTQIKIGQLDLNLSSLSIIKMSPIFSKMIISDLDIHIERKDDSLWTINGMKLFSSIDDNTDSNQELNFEAWLINQDNIVFNNVNFTFQDHLEQFASFNIYNAQFKFNKNYLNMHRLFFTAHDFAIKNNLLKKEVVIDFVWSGSNIVDDIQNANLNLSLESSNQKSSNNYNENYSKTNPHASKHYNNDNQLIAKITDNISQATIKHIHNISNIIKNQDLQNLRNKYFSQNSKQHHLQNSNKEVISLKIVNHQLTHLKLDFDIDGLDEIIKHLSNNLIDFKAINGSVDIMLNEKQNRPERYYQFNLNNFNIEFNDNLALMQQARFKSMQNYNWLNFNNLYSKQMNNIDNPNQNHLPNLYYFIYNYNLPYIQQNIAQNNMRDIYRLNDQKLNLSAKYHIIEEDNFDRSINIDHIDLYSLNYFIKTIGNIYQNTLELNDHNMHTQLIGYAHLLDRFMLSSHIDGAIRNIELKYSSKEINVQTILNKINQRDKNKINQQYGYTHNSDNNMHTNHVKYTKNIPNTFDDISYAFTARLYNVSLLSQADLVNHSVFGINGLVNIWHISDKKNNNTSNSFSNDINTDHNKIFGKVWLHTNNGGFKLDKWFFVPYHFNHLDLRINFSYDQDWVFQLDKLSTISTNDFMINLDGSYIYTPNADNHGYLNLNAHLNKIYAKHVGDYLPRSIGEETRLWLINHIKSGYAKNANLSLNGILDDFPFNHKLQDINNNSTYMNYLTSKYSANQLSNARENMVINTKLYADQLSNTFLDNNQQFINKYASNKHSKMFNLLYKKNNYSMQYKTSYYANGATQNVNHQTKHQPNQSNATEREQQTIIHSAFYIDSEIEDLVLEYDPNWPWLTNLNGKFSLLNDDIFIDLDNVSTADNTIDHVAGMITNITNFYQTTLFINAFSTNAQTKQLFAFIANSPIEQTTHLASNIYIDDYIGNSVYANYSTKYFKYFKSGYNYNSRLFDFNNYNINTKNYSIAEKNKTIIEFLHLAIPFADPNHTFYSGKCHLIDNDLSFNGKIPEIKNASGEIYFDNYGLNIQNMQFILLDGYFQLNGSTKHDHNNTHEKILELSAGGKGVNYNKLSQIYLPSIQSNVDGVGADMRVNLDLNLNNGELKNISIIDNIDHVAIDLPSSMGKYSGEARMIAFNLNQIDHSFYSGKYNASFNQIHRDGNMQSYSNGQQSLYSISLSDNLNIFNANIIYDLSTDQINAADISITSPQVTANKSSNFTANKFGNTANNKLYYSIYDQLYCNTPYYSTYNNPHYASSN